MTCIVALARDGKVWIGGDSVASESHSVVQRADGKVFEKDGYLFGFTSSYRMGQLLRYRLDIPQRHPDTDLMQFMATDFIDAVRACLKEYGFAKTRDNADEGGQFLVATEGRIFNICDDFQVGESLHPYDACGCGVELALGALFITHASPAKPENILERALEAAEMYSGKVRRPFAIVGPAEK